MQQLDCRSSGSRSTLRLTDWLCIRHQVKRATQDKKLNRESIQLTVEGMVVGYQSCCQERKGRMMFAYALLML